MKNSDRFYMFAFGFVIALAVILYLGMRWYIPNYVWDLYNIETLPINITRQFLLPHFVEFLFLSICGGIAFTLIIEELDNRGY